MSDERLDLVRGTLDMLVLRALVPGALHGYQIARRLQQQPAMVTTSLPTSTRSCAPAAMNAPN